MLATAVIGYYSWQRSGYSRNHGLLELFRTAIVALIAFLLNSPELIQEHRPDSKPTIAILWDDSRSMQTQDVLTGGSPSRVAITRAEAIKSLTKSATWCDLDQRLNVVVQPIAKFATDQPQPLAKPATESGRTDLHRALVEASTRINHLLGIVVISDGDWNEGQPPIEAATQLRLQDIPIFTVPVGSSVRLPDVELASIDVPTIGATGKSIRVPFTIDSSLPREYLTTVSMKTSDGDILTKDVHVAPMGRTRDFIQWTPGSTGDVMLSVSIPKHGDETVPSNNQKTAPIQIRDEKLRALLVESNPRWEYRYLRNALSRDPGVDVSCLLFHPKLEKVGGGSKDYIKAFPEAIEDLTEFDVVFLGDVGLDDGQLTLEQCELIRGLVEHQASGLVFIPGFLGRQLSLQDSALSDLIPVVMDNEQPDGWGSRTPGHFELTESGSGSLLTKLAETIAENARVWEQLPGFHWYAPIVRAKAGTQTLAVHGDMSNQYGRLPLLVTRTFGDGKVLFMGTDGAWRWRKGVEDKYHYRFWGQVVRWMAYQRNMAKGQSMRLLYAPDQPQLDQTLTLSAHVMNDGGEPLQTGDVVARVQSPSGKSETIRLITDGQRWGVFDGAFVPTEPGKHEVTITSSQTKGILKVSFFVRGETIEAIGKPARPSVLEELSLVSRGKSVRVDEVNQVIRILGDLPIPAPSIRRLQLRSHPLLAALLILALSAFWIWRKAAGLT